MGCEYLLYKLLLLENGDQENNNDAFSSFLDLSKIPTTSIIMKCMNLKFKFTSRKFYFYFFKVHNKPTEVIKFSEIHRISLSHADIIKTTYVKSVDKRRKNYSEKSQKFNRLISQQEKRE